MREEPGEDGKSKYLVKFLDEEELQWADEVSEDLLKRWVRHKKPEAEAGLLALAGSPAAGPAGAGMMPVVGGGAPLTEFFAKAIASEMNKFLRRRLNFSTKNPACMTPRHKIMIHIPPEVSPVLSLSIKFAPVSR